MLSMKRGLLTGLALIALAASDAAAGQYPGRGDTGWVLAGKRDCCNEAIALAQQDSAAVCHSVGGSPNPMRGGVQRRGYCQWESAVGNDGLTRFHCWAEATIPCR
jgi:hypothetical protein